MPSFYKRMKSDLKEFESEAEKDFNKAAGEYQALTPLMLMLCAAANLFGNAYYSHDYKSDRYEWKVIDGVCSGLVTLAGAQSAYNASRMDPYNIFQAVVGAKSAMLLLTALLIIGGNMFLGHRGADHTWKYIDGFCVGVWFTYGLASGIGSTAFYKLMHGGNAPSQ